MHEPGSGPVAVQPTQQDAHGAGVVPQLMTRTGKDPEIGTSVGVGNGPSIQLWHEFIIGAVKHQQRTLPDRSRCLHRSNR